SWHFSPMLFYMQSGTCLAWFNVPGSRFTVERMTDSRLLTLNLEPKIQIRYVEKWIQKRTESD
ncbi:hypothetical protein ACFL6U_29650, partial [Planctomycetota bacterium]